jgi:Domain of unknown function (DUF1906)
VIEGVDYSDARPSPTGLANVGKIFAGRYVGAGFGPKMLLRTEAEELSAAGLKIVSLVEGAAQDALNGYGLGVQHANLAHNWHIEQGFPWPVPCYFAVDWDVQPGQWGAVAQYFRGVASVIGTAYTGIYGGLNAIEWAQRDKVAAWFFQTYAWSGGIWAPGVHIEQYHNDVFIVGGSVDLDRAPTVEYGGWTMTGAQDEATQIDQTFWTADSIVHASPTITGGTWKGNPAELGVLVREIADNVSAIKAGLQTPIVPPAPGGSTVDLEPVLTGLTALSTQLSDMEQTATVDAVAIGKAMTADPGFVAALAAAIAAQLGSQQGEITLSGPIVLAVKPPAA